jgi:hypothetical protein
MISIDRFIIIVLVLAVLYLFNDKLNSKEGMANMADVDITAIKSLSDIAQMLQKEGGLTIPGDLTISGKLNVKGITTSEGNLDVKGTITSEGDLNVAKTITSKNLNATHAKLTTISDVNTLTGNHITLEHNLIVKGIFNAGKSGNINGKAILKHGDKLKLHDDKNNKTVMTCSNLGWVAAGEGNPCNDAEHYLTVKDVV